MSIVSKVYTKEELCLMERIPEACGIVIFGASGDLAHRKLFPSLWRLVKEKVMPANYYILGVARSDFSDQAFRETIKESIKEKDSPELKSFLDHCFYISGDYASSSTYQALSKKLLENDKTFSVDHRYVFYLSTPPELDASIVEQLGKAKLTEESGNQWRRVIIEKPFGRDVSSACELNKRLRAILQEGQIYRIDHYLGKETVQNILMFRFANAIYEPIWNQKYIDHVQITAAETVGVEHRAGYYDQSGALRDMFQNHLLQLLCLVAMEPPCSFEADAVRDEKTKVLRALHDETIADWRTKSLRGQYQGYRKEDPRLAQSTTETYVALRAEIDNWRWQGVPFYLRSGKKMADRVTEIAIQFKSVPSSIFKPLLAEQLSANILRFRIQPNEGISLSLETKHPGPKLCLSTTTMTFNYAEAFGTEPPESYTRLFLDVMLGDQTLFARNDWLERSWEYLNPLLEDWKDQKEKGLLFYPEGSWGPKEAEQWIAQDHRSWTLHP